MNNGRSFLHYQPASKKTNDFNIRPPLLCTTSRVIFFMQFTTGSSALSDSMFRFFVAFSLLGSKISSGYIWDAKGIPKGFICGDFKYATGMHWIYVCNWDAFGRIQYLGLFFWKHCFPIKTDIISILFHKRKQLLKSESNQTILKKELYSTFLWWSRKLRYLVGQRGAPSTY